MPKNTRKKTWRKNEIGDVEEALEEEKLIKKLKQKKIKGKGKDDDSGLFTVDTAGSSQGLSRAARRAAAREKLFPKKGPNIGLSACEQMKLERMERSVLAGANAKARGSSKNMFDLWNAPVPTRASECEAQVAGFDKVKLRDPPAQPVPKTTAEHKVSEVPAVLPAHEGQSMNPETSAFEDLSCTAAARELEREREEDAEERSMKPMTHKLKDYVDDEALKNMGEEAKLEAFRAAVCPIGASADPAEEDDDGNYLPGSAKFKLKKESKRRRERAVQKADLQRAVEKKRKKLEKSVGDLGAILKDLNEQEQVQKDRKAYRELMTKRSHEFEATRGIVPKRRKLWRNTGFTEEALAIPDAVAARKGIRSMPLDGSAAVNDRISSILRRGLAQMPPQGAPCDLHKAKFRTTARKRKRTFISPLMRKGFNA